MTNINTSTTNPLLTIERGQLGLFIETTATGESREAVHHLTAWLAQKGMVSILDCGCAFNASRIMELIHLQNIYFKAAMDRIQVSRAFTAYQFKTQITQTSTADTPRLILYPLTLFYDDNIDLPEGMRLLGIVIEHLRRLCRVAPVILAVKPPPVELEERIALLNALTKVADQLFMPQPTTPGAAQLGLFKG